jgi:flagellar hook-associated protein 2
MPASPSGVQSKGSSTNTFTDAIPGVTFTVSQLAEDVTISVDKDVDSISDKIESMVDVANGVVKTIDKATGKGAILQGDLGAELVDQSLMSAVSMGVAGGGSLAQYGIDLDSDGTFSFDADTFSDVYAADPSGSKEAVSALASSFADSADDATAPVTGTITAAISSADEQADDLSDRIDDWGARLDDIRARMTQKFNAMETALAKLQSQSTYLTAMLESINSDSDSD